MNIISCRQTFCFSYIPHKITSKSWIKKFLLVLCQRLRHSYSILLLCLLNKTPFIKHKLLRLQLIKESLQLPQLFQKIILRRCSTAARSGYAVGLSYIEPDVSTGRLLSLTHCLGDTSGAFLLAVERAKIVGFRSTESSLRGRTQYAHF